MITRRLLTRWLRGAVLPLFGSLLLLGCQPARVSGGNSGTDAPPTGTPAAEGTLQVSFLDVGQGDAALVRAPDGTAVVIDGGPPDAGPAVIGALKEAGVEKVEWMVGSHPHSDHIGGLVDLLREVPVAQALDPGYNHGTSLQRTYVKLLQEKKVRVTRARAGQTYDWGGARFEILAPEEPLIKGTRSDANNNSIVGRLVFGKARFLFTGDMEEAERARLLKSVRPEQLRSDVLKVAHHGSHNGTDPAFLQAVKPDYAVVSLKKGNEYGHPHREALDALSAAGVKILRTDQLGTITFTSDGTSVVLKQTTRPLPTGSQASESTPEFKGRVIGNTSSKVYHAPDCESIPRPERRVEMESAAAAEKAGYRKHGKCIR